MTLGEEKINTKIDIDLKNIAQKNPNQVKITPPPRTAKEITRKKLVLILKIRTENMPSQGKNQEKNPPRWTKK